ncbi:hypothetical protein K501DRAFT_288693 [Backusella circina FSU 941]|nr:hypothetical protein K501DRAFT_288693 [Backusella circina FSU 941]
MEQENTSAINTIAENSNSKRTYGHWSHERDKAYVTAAIKYFKGGSPEHAKWTDIQDTVNKVQPDLGRLALSTVKNRKKELLDAYQKRREGLSIHTSAESTELDKLITDLVTVMQAASPKIKKEGEDRPKKHQEQEESPGEEGTSTGERRPRPSEEDKEEINAIKRPRNIQPAIDVPYREARMKLPADRNIQLDSLNVMHQQAATLVRIENLLVRLVNQFENGAPHSQQPHPSMNGRHIAPMPGNPPPPLNIRPFIPPESSQNKNKK